MILKTFRKEYKELWREGRVRISIIVVLGLLLLATWISAKQYHDVNEQYEHAKTTERDNWDNQGEKNPHSAAHYGTYVFKPKLPLSLVDQGVDKYVGTSIFLEAHQRNESKFIAAADQTSMARFGDLTPDFVLLFIIPLLIILLGYNSFTKEREMGTLTLLKSQGLSPWKWMLGKWIALFFPIFTITILLFVIAGLLLSNLDDFGVFSWSSLFVLCLVYLVYYAIFSNLVLLVSAMTKKSGVALVLSLSLWILACLVAPKAASNFAENKYPYPTRQEFALNIQKDTDKGLDGHNPWSEEAKSLEEKVLKEHGVDSLQQLPFNFDGYLMQKGEEYEAEVFEKHYKKLRELNNKQSGVYKNLAVLSPYLPTRFLSMGIAQTGYAAYADFTEAAEKYRVATQKFLNDDLANSTTYGQYDYQAGPDFWKQLPEFTYEPPNLNKILSDNSSSLMILGIWLLFSFGLLFLTTKKI